MMPASTTLASSQPRWGDQKAPITTAPKTSQNPFRHLVERGAVRKREQEVAGRTHAAVGWGPHGSVPASLVIATTRLSSRGVAGFRLGQRMAAPNKDLARSNNKGRTRRGARRSAIFRGACAPRVPPSSGKRKWRRRTDVWREATSPARGFRRLTSDGSAAHSSGAANWRSPRCGVSALPVFHRPLAARVRAEAEHELALGTRVPEEGQTARRSPSRATGQA